LAHSQSLGSHFLVACSRRGHNEGLYTKSIRAMSVFEHRLATRSPSRQYCESWPGLHPAAWAPAPGGGKQLQLHFAGCYPCFCVQGQRQIDACCGDAPAGPDGMSFSHNFRSVIGGVSGPYRSRMHRTPSRPRWRVIEASASMRDWARTISLIEHHAHDEKQRIERSTGESSSMLFLQGRSWLRAR